MSTPLHLVIFGRQGAGKGTQSVNIAETFGCVHVSTGDMLRAAVKAGTPVGKKAKAVMDAGELVSDEIVIGIAEERLSEPDAQKGFLLDGFPRTLAQAEALDQMLTQLGAPLECCLALTVDEEAVVDRLLKRAEIEGRADDNEETIRERMSVYREQTAPLLDYYERAGKLLSVDGMGDVDAITQRIEEALQS